MIEANASLKRVTLSYPSFAKRSEIRRLKELTAVEMEKRKATRGVLRVLTEEPMEDERFKLEAKVETEKGVLAVFGYNLPERIPSEMTLHEETSYLSRVLCSRKNPLRDFEMVRLSHGIQAELSVLYSGVYPSFPIGLDEESFSRYLKSSIAYGVMENGRIAAALFGEPHKFGGLMCMEFTLSAMPPTRSGIDMTTALASRIRDEAYERFGTALMTAETIAAPVMHSCHDLGMQCRGVLRNHYDLETRSGKRYSNLYLWSL